MSAIYLDTVGLIALWDVADQWHPAADTAFVQLVLREEVVCNDDFCAARMCKRSGALAIPKSCLLAPKKPGTPGRVDRPDGGRLGVAGKPTSGAMQLRQALWTMFPSS